MMEIMTHANTGESLPLHRSILGKTMPKNYPLIHHLLDTGAVAVELWDTVIAPLTRKNITHGMKDENDNPITEKQAKDIVAYLAAMHDIGKATPHWQRRVLNLPLNHYSLTTGGCEPLPLPETPTEGMGVHQKNSAIFFTPINGETTSTLGDAPTAHSIAMCLHGHHGLYEDFSPNEVEKIIHGIRVPRWEEQQKLIEQDIITTLNLDLTTLKNLDYWETPSIILTTGIIILADWVASRADFINSQQNYDHPQDHYRKATALAQQFISGWGLASQPWQPNLTWLDIFPNYTIPNPFQQSIIDGVEEGSISGAGLLMISAPMGAGKTETALYAGANIGSSVGANGIWMNLPTQATANAMFPRSTVVAPRIFQGEDHSVALLHSNSTISQAIESVAHKNFHLGSEAVAPAQEQLADGDTGEGCLNTGESNLFISDFLIEKRLGGMSDITVGTVDQMIKATTRLKHNQLRWLAVSGNVVMLDEIHDFDPYTFTLIKKHVAWCGALGVPVIAISATLSGESQRELIEAYWSGQDTDVTPAQQAQFIDDAIPHEGIGSPAWFFAPLTPGRVSRNRDIPTEKYPPYHTTLHHTHNFIPTVKRLVKETVDTNKGQALVVCNTVDQAVATFQELQDDGFDTVLLHSRMPHEDRSRIVERVLQRSGKPTDQPREPYVLVSTQIVQQSLDIDFDVLISSFAPLDETLQRIGRVHRHNQKGKRSPAYEWAPQVHLLIPPALPELFTGFIDGEPADEMEFICGITPYTKWQMMGSYHVLKKIAPQDGSPWAWDAKGDITSTYAKYAVAHQMASDRSFTNKHLNNAFAQFHSDRLALESQASHRTVSIPSPLQDDLVGFTSEYTTTRGDAPQTRLIEDSVTLLPLWNFDGKWFMNPELTYEVTGAGDLTELRHIGLRCLSVTEKFAAQIEETELFETTFRDRSSLPPFIRPVFAPHLGKKVKLDDTLGLVRLRESFTTWT